jgi:hypothetical protein
MRLHRSDSIGAVLSLVTCLNLPGADSQPQLLANPSTGTYILIDKSHAPPADRLSITSDIPANIQRYADINANFFVGSQPVDSSAIRIVVTSDCDGNETNVIPSVELNEGTISIKLNQTEHYLPHSDDSGKVLRTTDAMLSALRGVCGSFGGLRGCYCVDFWGVWSVVSERYQQKSRLIYGFGSVSCRDYR